MQVRGVEERLPRSEPLPVRIADALTILTTCQARFQGFLCISLLNLTQQGYELRVTAQFSR